MHNMHGLLSAFQMSLQSDVTDAAVVADVPHRPVAVTNDLLLTSNPSEMPNPMLDDINFSINRT
jgi:hypothetical protein